MQRTAARGTDERRVSASADIRRLDPSDNNQSLLRALQERTVERIGSNKSIPFDCRLVAASKDDLKLLSDQQKFRADLYYRIGVALIELPPLRERREDIPLLFEHFVLLAAGRYERVAPVLSNSQLADLMAYAWPGNVRELRNVADRFVLGLLGDRLTQARGAGEPTAPRERLGHASGADRARDDHGSASTTSRRSIRDRRGSRDRAPDTQR